MGSSLAIQQGFVQLPLGRGTIEVEAVTERIFRFRWLPQDPTPTLLPSPALVPVPALEGQAIVRRTREGAQIETEAMRLEVGSNPFRFTLWDQRGERVVQDAGGFFQEGDWLGCRLRAVPGEAYLGLGEQVGFLNHRGRRLTLWCSDNLPHLPSTNPLYQAIPFLLVLRPKISYGLFLHSTWRSHWDLAASDEGALTFACDAGARQLEFFLIYGPHPQAVLEGYTLLTGRAPLPPLWALGYHQSRYSYYPAETVLQLAQEFRARGIPCDAIYLDIHYMDGYRVFTWDPERFPDPRGLMEELRGMGVKVVTIVDPGIKEEPGYRVYDEGLARGYFCRHADGRPYVGRVWPGPAVFPDFTRQEVRSWWADLHEPLLNAGVAGIWNDMNEPSVFDGPGKTMDPAALHGDLPHAAVHNAYGLLMSQATYEGLIRMRPDRRPFVLTRAGFAGIQRYAAVWTGDNSSWWEHLAQATPMLLGLGLSGVPFVGADVGGFLEDSSAELFARWIELGTFTPFCRNHTAFGTRPQEPWSFGPEVEEIARRYIRWRYRWLPLWYSLFWECHKTGLPPMRPLLLAFPDDPESLRTWDQFLLGDAILVAPVDRPGARHRLVYLPPGQWCDFWTGRAYRGPRHVAAAAPLDRLPLFLRAGAVIPEGPEMDYVGQANPYAVTLHLHPGPWKAAGSGSVVDLDRARSARTQWRFVLYEDDGETLAYTRGAYRETEVQFGWEGGELAVEIKATGAFEPRRSHDLLAIHRWPTSPNAVLASGRALQDWRYDAGSRILWIRLACLPEPRRLRIVP